MLGTWIDYSGGTVSGATMAANGIEGAIRYVGIGGAGKRLTHAEYADHCAHGRQTMAVVEMSTTDADGGYNAGVANAKAALADLAVETAGLPPITCVFAANDKPSYVAADVDYVRGFRDVFGASALVGPYGFGSFIVACHAADLAPISWQAGQPPNMTGTDGIAMFWQRQGTAGDGADGPATPTTIVLDSVECDLSNRLLEVPTMTTPADFWNFEIAIPAAVKRPGDPDTVPAAEMLLYANRAGWSDNDLLVALTTQVTALTAAVTALQKQLGALQPSTLSGTAQVSVDLTPVTVSPTPAPAG